MSLHSAKCPSSCNDSCNLKRQISKSLHKIYFPTLAPLLGWCHEYVPGKAIVSRQRGSGSHLPAESRCSRPRDPRPGTLQAGNAVGLQLRGERDLGGTSCCP